VLDVVLLIILKQKQSLEWVIYFIIAILILKLLVILAAQAVLKMVNRRKNPLRQVIELNAPRQMIIDHNARPVPDFDRYAQESD